ncbi:hypothetical protein FRC02_009835 [Tulasnella sp. 418]|nr:hypothetical protein FRC02_009835 [Tulasnella sp. 418]
MLRDVYQQLLSLLSKLILYSIRAIHTIGIVWSCILPRRQPLALETPRRLKPSHVALLLDPGEITSEEHQNIVLQDMIECVERVVEWAMSATIETLTVYDEKGLLKSIHQDISQAISTRLGAHVTQIPTQSPSTPPPQLHHPPFQNMLAIENLPPLTPPPSESGATSSSIEAVSPSISFKITTGTHTDAPQSTQLRHRREDQVSSQTAAGIRLDIICRDQGKPSVALAARNLSIHHIQTTPLEVASANKLLEAEFTSPDLLIVHPLIYSPSSLPHKGNIFSCLPQKFYIPLPKPLEMHGFPPWQIRLTEIYYDPLPPKRFFSLIFSNLACSHSKGLYHRMEPRVPTKTRSAVITEKDFRSALDQYSQADMKVGK